MSDTKKVAVIGAGPGGYAAAFMAADLGMSVTLIDPEVNPGGVCLYYGCIPSKALLHVAGLINESAEAKNWGVTFTKPKVNLDKLRSWKNDVVLKLTGGLGQLSKQRKLTYIKGTATFVDNTTLEITSGGKKTNHQFDNIILATGSRPATIPIAQKFTSRIMDSTRSLALKDIPNKLLVIGGGYIGLEMGTIYASLGSKVTVVEMTDGLLPGADRDLVKVLSKRVENLFEAVLLETKVSDIKEQKNGVKVEFEGKHAKNAGKLYDRVLLAVGRTPNSTGLGLENTKVKINDRGFVQVDEQRRTDEPNIFAIGDVTGEPMLAHKATHEGRVAASVIAGKTAAYEPKAIPAIVFTDPEIAWCGLTEVQAKKENRTIKVARFPWAASGRAASLGQTDGVTKLIIDADTDRVLGMGIAGHGAGELIAEGVLAIEMAATAEDIGLSIHPHPTLSETIMETADLLYGLSTHYHRPQKK
ncbi:MAG: dihydrolipoyl dehydrogenase [Candidatus Zixiibacteriota bacterium]